MLLPDAYNSEDREKFDLGPTWFRPKPKMCRCRDGIGDCKASALDGSGFRFRLIYGPVAITCLGIRNTGLVFKLVLLVLFLML